MRQPTDRQTAESGQTTDQDVIRVHTAHSLKGGRETFGRRMTLKAQKNKGPTGNLGAGESLDGNTLTGNLKPRTGRLESPRTKAAAETGARRGRRRLDGRCETARDGKRIGREYQIVAVGAPQTPYAPRGASPSQQAPDSRTASRTRSCETHGMVVRRCHVRSCYRSASGAAQYAVPGKPRTSFSKFNPPPTFESVE